MKNIANADRPKSMGAMLPPRPFRGSGKVAQTACNSDRREGKSCIPTLNQTFADSRILKISKFPTFRIAGGRGHSLWLAQCDFAPCVRGVQPREYAGAGFGRRASLQGPPGKAWCPACRFQIGVRRFLG